MNNPTNTQQQMIGANQAQQVQSGQDLLISPLTKISDGTKVSMTNLTNLLNKFKTIPQQINELRNKGTGEVTALQKQLSEAKTTLAKDNSDYVNGLVTRINSINTLLDGLKNNITGLDSKANEITTALGQPNSTAGGTTSPRSVASGSSTPGPVTNPVITPVTPPAITGDTLITVDGKSMPKNQIVAFLNDKINRTQKDYKPQYRTMLNNFKNATTVNDAKNVVISLRLNQNKTAFKGGKRSRKIRRKYSKKHSKKLRRSSK